MLIKLTQKLLNKIVSNMMSLYSVIFGILEESFVSTNLSDHKSNPKLLFYMELKWGSMD